MEIVKMFEPLRLTCPVCRAGFRGETICSRCGADLSPLMELVAKAYILRRRSQEAFNRDHDTSLASRLIREANHLHRTPTGTALEALMTSSQRYT